MNWVLYLLVSTAVVGKTDISRKWIMPTQAACQAAVNGAKIGQAPALSLNAGTTASVVLVCVQEPKP